MSKYAIDPLYFEEDEDNKFDELKPGEIVLVRGETNFFAVILDKDYCVADPKHCFGDAGGKKFPAKVLGTVVAKRNILDIVLVGYGASDKNAKKASVQEVEKCLLYCKLFRSSEYIESLENDFQVLKNYLGGVKKNIGETSAYYAELIAFFTQTIPL